MPLQFQIGVAMGEDNIATTVDMHEDPLTIAVIKSVYAYGNFAARVARWDRIIAGAQQIDGLGN